mgnify:CR=1 FL=1
MNKKQNNYEKGISNIGISNDFRRVSFAQAAPVEVPVVEKPQQSKKLVFSEIYMNDLPEAVMDRLALEGAMIKQAFMTYGIDGSRIYKINVLTSDAHEQTLFLGEDGKILK